jgi:hypothetical protein
LFSSIRRGASVSHDLARSCVPRAARIELRTVAIADILIERGGYSAGIVGFLSTVLGESPMRTTALSVSRRDNRTRNVNP